MVTVGEKIKMLRKEAGFTQKEFAKKLNKSERMIQNYENSKINPKFEILREISKIFNIAEHTLSETNIIDKNRFFILLKNKNITIDKLSKELNIPKNIINNFLEGKELVTKADFNILNKICLYLETHPIYLLNKYDFDFSEHEEFKIFKILFSNIQTSSNYDVQTISIGIFDLLSWMLFKPISEENVQLLLVLRDFFETIYLLNAQLINENCYDKKKDKLQENFDTDTFSKYNKLFSECISKLVEYYSNSKN